MSKAMDAIRQLERVQDGIGGLAKIMGMPEALALLRDYITTTEAREADWTIALAGEQLAHETDLTQSASHIKELEEALGVARNLLTDVRDAIKKLPATDGRVIGLGQFIPLINAQVEKTIGGRG